MKSLFCLLALFSSFAFASPEARSVANAPKLALVAEATTWSQTESFIRSHAVRCDDATLTMLRAEASLGVRTWVLTGSAANTNNSIFDGPGIGWPAAGSVITFACVDDALTAAAMVQAATIVTEAPARN
ncbi:MAG: hypothetical protein U0S12_12665 [Fimbriimonadales bacterium]